MKIEINFFFERKHSDDFGDEVISFCGEVRISELLSLLLNDLDLALLDDVGRDRRASPADLLLALEMIFRRHEQKVYRVETTDGSFVVTA